MTFGSTFGRTFSPTFQPKSQAAAAVATDWWLAGGIPAANCIAAYRAHDAADLAASYVNLANPGTYDAAKITNDAVFNSSVGWSFTNNTYVLSTGVVPENDQTWSMIVKFSDAYENGRCIAGCENSAGNGKFYVWAKRGGTNDDRLYGSGGFLGTGVRVTNGVLAVAGANCYYNGSLDGTIATAWSVGARSIIIGDYNLGSGTSGIAFGSGTNFDGHIQALAIYDIDISSYISELTTAMEAMHPLLDPSDFVDDYVQGVWSWYTKPTYVYENSKHYFTVIDTQNADLKIHSYDSSTDALTSFTLNSDFGVDDHNSCSMLFRESDGKILTFYATHNDTTIRQRISTNAGDVSAWGAEASLDASIGGTTYNYPIPIQLTGEINDPIYLFYTERGVGIRGEYFSVSSDDGATWSAGTQMFANGAERPYFQIARNGTDRIDFACTQGHPNEVAGCSIYHFYYTGGKYYESDGTEFTGSLPLATTDVTQVYDGSTTESWVWDIAIDSGGNPVIVFATFPTPASDHRYYYARWTGSAWDTHQICTAGGPLYSTETYYSGGITLDKGDPSIVWCSRKVNHIFEIYKYVTADGGSTWTGTEITSESVYSNCRPICADGASGMSPLYWTGEYITYSDTNCYVKYR